MIEVECNDISFEYKIYDAKSRSIRNEFISHVGGLIKTKSKNHNTTIQALKNFSIKMKSGDRVGLVGHNGSGKSTLLKLLSGSLFPTSGMIKVSGNVSSIIDMNMGLDMELSGIENIRIRSALHDFNKFEHETFYNEVLNFSELSEDFLNMPVRTYSSGMRMRLAFSLSTVIMPEILLLDEIVAVGDNDFKIKSQKKIEELIKKSNIFVLASHDKNLLRSLCDRILYFEKGSLINEEKN